MTEWLHAEYRDFFAVPRTMLCINSRGTFFFNSRFDPAANIYMDHYEVYRLPPLSESETCASWFGLETRAIERLPDLPVHAFPFDTARRAFLPYDPIRWLLERRTDPASNVAADGWSTESVSMIPFAVQRIDHVVLRVRKLERSIRFYRTVLGCEVARIRDDLGLVHLKAGASMIDLVSIDGKLGRAGGAPAGRGGRNVDHVCLRVDPFDERSLVEHLARFGIRPTGAVTVNFGAEGNGPSLYVEDPDGNVVELKGPACP